MANLLTWSAVSQPSMPSLQSFWSVPSPRTPQAFWEMEEAVQTKAGQVADQILSHHLSQLHQDPDFVRQAVEQARTDSPVPLVNKGLKEVSVLLSGGTRCLLKTPYLLPDRRGKRGRKRTQRGPQGVGRYPVLEALGIRDGVSPATRSQIALYTVQAGSYQEAIALLSQRGFWVDPSTLARIASSTAQADIALREAALDKALEMPICADGPLCGKRVRVSVDGGRVRTRKTRKGRKTCKGRHAFNTPWREPRVLVIDLLSEEGKTDSLRLPLYDVLIGDADATFALLVGYLRLLGAAYAQVVEFIADGADWIWDRAEVLRQQAEIPAAIWVEVVDFYHASERLHAAVELCRSLSGKKRDRLFRQLRHTLRTDPQGVALVIAQLQQEAKTRRGKKMQKAIAYFEKHAHRMRYVDLDERNLPVGSGQVESAVRRVVNLRFKAPGTFWNEVQVDGLMHLRACFKAGRWEEMMQRVLTRIFQIPSFEPLTPQQLAALPLESLDLASTGQEIHKAA
jgi:hypothetical protein